MNILKDSWLIDGNCKECRRKKHCNKPCKMNQNRVKNIIFDALVPPVMKKMMKGDFK